MAVSPFLCQNQRKRDFSFLVICVSVTFLQRQGLLNARLVCILDFGHVFSAPASSCS